MNSNNKAELNPRLIAQNATRPRSQNPRFVYVNQSTLQTVQNNNANIIQTAQASNQSSITTKLCKFFKNLLELERDQGRYKESVAVIQKYINKEINLDELGVQLKGNASKATLPDSLMMSLNSNIDDLRREMFYGRVKIAGINPPPENIFDQTNNQTASIIANNNIINNNINIRLPNNQIMTQRPTTFPAVVAATVTNNNNISTRSIQPQSGSQLIRPTIQAIQPNARQFRPATNNSANNNSIFTSQPVLNISQSTSLRTIAPSSPIRPSFVQNQSISTSSQIRTVAVSTTALTNIKSNPLINNSSGSDELKIEAVSSVPADNSVKPIQQIIQPQVDMTSTASSQSCSLIGNTNISLPTNILNHNNYRQKLNEFINSFGSDTSTTNTGNASIPISLSISDEALNYVSEALENFSITLLEQAAVFACHRQELFKDNPNYKKIDDVRSQMKYLQDLEEYQRASEEERHKAELFKQAKSRSKIDNQEQQKIKETVRKIQEYDKNCDEYSRANMTALKAIGNKRKLIDGEEGGLIGAPNIKTTRFVAPGANLNSGFANHLPSSQIFINQNFMAAKVPRNPNVSRFRNKRIILKDFQLVLDQDVKLKRFKTYKKIFTYGRY